MNKLRRLSEMESLSDCHKVPQMVQIHYFAFSKIRSTPEFDCSALLLRRLPFLIRDVTRVAWRNVSTNSSSASDRRLSLRVMNTVSDRPSPRDIRWTATSLRRAYGVTTERGSIVTPRPAPTQPMIPSSVPNSNWLTKVIPRAAQEAFKTLTVRVPYSEDEELMNAPFPQRSFQRAMLGRTYQHEFFHENESRLQIIMLNRSGDERSVQPILENGLKEISRCARSHPNIHVSMRRRVRFQYRR